MRLLLSSLLVAAGVLAGCGDNGDNLSPTERPDGSVEPRPDAAVDAALDAPAPDAGDPLNPMRLADTGLYADFANQIISSDVTEYQPQFELWADGAVKRRWVQLPAGTQIDSSDMSFWQYPEDTKLWKQFSRGGLLVETRLYWKQGPDASDWKPFTFVWNAAQDDAVAESFGVTDALGTGHDVPNIFDCAICHGPQPDNVLGYSAIQLDGANSGENLADLVGDGRLTDNPPGAGPTFFPLPGNAIDQAALGYLHGNCGGCHSPGSSIQDIVPLELRLDPANMATVADTAAYTTAVGVTPTLAIGGATSIIEPGSPATSALHIRVTSLGNPRMPPLASTVIDTDGVAALEAWINVVPPP